MKSGGGARKRRGCLKRGCLGCGLLAFVGLLVLIGLAVAGRLVAPEAEPRVESLALDQAPSGASGRRAAEADALDPSTPARRGQLVLEIEEADLALLPAPAGSPLRVEAHYDQASHELLERRETGEGGEWRSRVSFRGKLGLLGIFRGAKTEQRIEVHVPVDLPLDLACRFRRGDSAIELGGLDLRRVDLDLRQGAHEVRFSRETVSPLEELRIDGRMGALVVSGLGWASPARAAIRQQMGAVSLDLTGSWRTASVVDVRFRLGACDVGAPPDVPLVLDAADVDAGNAEVDLPARARGAEPAPSRPVRLSATGVAGGLSVHQR